MFIQSIRYRGMSLLYSKRYYISITHRVRYKIKKMFETKKNHTRTNKERKYRKSQYKYKKTVFQFDSRNEKLNYYTVCIVYGIYYLTG